MFSCIICGDREIPTSSGKRFQPLYEALKVDIDSIPGWNLEKESVPLCSSCSQISECLSIIVKQLKSLEENYMAKTKELKKLLKKAESEDKTDSGAVNTFRKLALGFTFAAQKRGRGRPTKKNSATNTKISNPTTLGNCLTIKNVLSESEQSNAEEITIFRTTRNKRKTLKSLQNSDASLLIIDDLKIEVKQEIESENEFQATQKFDDSGSFFETVEEVETFKSEDNLDAANELDKRSTRNRTSRLKKVSKHSETDDTDNDDQDFSLENETAKTNLTKKRKTGSDKNVKMVEEEKAIEDVSSDDYTDTDDEEEKAAKKKWTKDKKSGKMFYNGVEVTLLADGFKCSICDDVTQFAKSGNLSKSKAKIKEHIVKHLGSFTCQICNKKYGRKIYLDAHIKTAHEKSQTVLCKICEKPFAHDSAMRRHKWSHKNEEEKKAAILAGKKPASNGEEYLISMQCDKCGIWCKGPYRLRKHAECHNEDRKRHMCQICGAIYNVAAGLVSHMKYKHEDNQLQWLQCPHCDKKFPQRSRLKKHLLSHTGEKHYVCEECGKGFTIRTKLNDHQLRHKNIRPHKCPADNCEMAFYSARDLRVHTRAYHDPSNPNPAKRKLPYRSENGTRKPPQKRRPRPPSSATTPDLPPRNVQRRQQYKDSTSESSCENEVTAAASNTMDPSIHLGISDPSHLNYNSNVNNLIGVAYPYPFSF